MYDDHVRTSGGYVSGEVKLGIALRLLAGGDAMDLGVIFDVTSINCTLFLYKVLLDWIVKTDIGDINMVKYLGDKEAMAKVSAGFSKRSLGVLKGAIGAIDGWLVRIVRPSYSRDGLRNIVSVSRERGFMPLMCNTLLMIRREFFGCHLLTKEGLMIQVVFKILSYIKSCMK